MAKRVATVDRKGYAAYIRSEAWAEKKREFRRSGLCKHKCASCGEKNAPLDIHHKSYKRLGNENLTDLMELCRTCHWLTHAEAKAKTSQKTNLWNAHKKVKRKRKGQLRS